eukprot:scaffold16334_cov97-Phaeocystis_antarctica.AAC.5
MMTVWRHGPERVNSPSKARAVGRRARWRASAHPDEAVHGATGPEGTNWRVVKQASGQLRTDGCVGPAAQRSGRQQGCVLREAPGAGSSLRSDLALDPEGVDG